jgi:hypothetical protein
MDKQAYLIKRLESNIQSCKESVDKFIEKLKEDPAYALSWGTGTFQTAANLKVYEMVYAALTAETPCSVQAVKETLMDRVLHKSKYPPQSTSPCSNLMEQYELAAYAELLSDLRYYEGE